MKHESAILLVDALREIPSRVRIKARGAEASDWGWPLFSPAYDYLETAKSGPIALSDVECIEIEREEQKHCGRLVPPVLIDHGGDIEAVLTKLKIAFQSQSDRFRILNEEGA